jgi:hypothetical protein
LAHAIRQVNAMYLRVPEPFRPDPASFDELDAEVDRAFATGDRERALAAIEAWRGYWLSRFAQALADARVGHKPGCDRQSIVARGDNARKQEADGGA